MSLSRPLLAILAAGLLATPAAAQQFDAKALHLDSLVAKVDIQVTPGATGVSVDLSGKPERVARTQLRLDGQTLRIEQDDWTSDRNSRNLDTDEESVRLRIVLAPGTDLFIGNFVGEVTAGDLDSVLTMDAKGAASLDIGRVRRADISVAGAVDLDLGDVAEGLRLDLRGAGDVDAGRVDGGLDVEVKGTGDVDVKAAYGPVRLDLRGVGDIDVEGGHAEPLKISAAGMGEVTYSGTFTDQSVRSTGLASVQVNGRKVKD